MSVKQFEIVIKLTPNDVDEEAFEDALEIKDDDQMRFKVLRACDRFLKVKFNKNLFRFIFLIINQF